MLWDIIVLVSLQPDSYKKQSKEKLCVFHKKLQAFLHVWG